MNALVKQNKGTKFGVQTLKKDNPAYDSDEDETLNESSSSFFGFRMPTHLNNDRPKAPVRQPSIEIPEKTAPANNRTPPSREPSLEGVGALQQMWQKYDKIVESMSSWGSSSSSTANSVTTRDSWDDSGATETFQSSRESWEDSSYIAPLPGDSFSSSQAPPGVRGVRRAASYSLAPVREYPRSVSTAHHRSAPFVRSVKRGASTGSVPSLLGSSMGPFKNPFNRTVTPLHNSFTHQGNLSWQGSLTHQGSFKSQDSLTRQNSFASSSRGAPSRQNSFASQGSLTRPGAAMNLTRQGSLKRNGSFNRRGTLKKQASIPRQNSFNLQQKSLNMQKFFSDYDKITTPDVANAKEGGPRPSVTGW